MSLISFAEAHEIIDQILWAEESLLTSAQQKNVDTSLLPCIVFTGSQNVGKTTLINALVHGNKGGKSDPKSSNPTIWASVLHLLDCPSYDISYPTEEIVDRINNADLVVQVCDMDANIRRSDVELARLIYTTDKPHLVVLNKIDLYSEGRQRRVIDNAERYFSSVICTSALKQYGLEQLMYILLDRLNESHQQAILPKVEFFWKRLKHEEARRKVRTACEKIIAERTREAAGIGIVNKPDASQLLAIQHLMIHQIAEIFSELGVTYTENPTPSQLAPSVTFFSTIVHVTKDILPTNLKSVAGFHATEWTWQIGQLAIDYFDQQVTEEVVALQIQHVLTAPHI